MIEAWHSHSIGIACTRIDCACADDLVPYVPFTIIHSYWGCGKICLLLLHLQTKWYKIYRKLIIVDVIKIISGYSDRSLSSAC